MIKWYGILGILLIGFAQITILLKANIPFVTFLVWLGYILLVDCFVYMVRGSSYLMSKPVKLLFMSLISINIWFIFEIFNIVSKAHGWFYVNLEGSPIFTFIRVALAFSTIMPAILETSDLIGSLHLFNKIKPKFKVHVNRFTVGIFLSMGIIFILLPFVLQTPWIWLFIWIGFIVLIDPILYFCHNEKSLLYQIQHNKFNVILSLMLAGYICGFLWEFWNYWAYTKWYYTVPILENIKIFEIPFLGFLAYGPFALELYVMYQFAKLLFSKKILGRII
jgi:hypothetical protein